jgi:hypothetical protein
VHINNVDSAIIPAFDVRLDEVKRPHEVATLKITISLAGAFDPHHDPDIPGYHVEGDLVLLHQPRLGVGRVIEISPVDLNRRFFYGNKR